MFAFAGVLSLVFTEIFPWEAEYSLEFDVQTSFKIVIFRTHSEMTGTKNTHE